MAYFWLLFNPVKYNFTPMSPFKKKRKKKKAIMVQFQEKHSEIMSLPISMKPKSQKSSGIKDPG